MKNKYELSICIPSNGKFEESRDSINSAINFCKLTSSELTISDNSNDTKKNYHWKKFQNKNIKLLKSNKKNSTENWYNSIKNASGIYTGILSDDDIIINISNPEIEYKNIYNHNILGIKPIIKLWNENVGHYATNIFNLDEENSFERVKSYTKLCNGNNTTLYSFFNTDIIKEIMELALFHPTRGGYSDWAFVLGLVSSGKILHDSSKVLIYKNNNWFGSEDFIKRQKISLYEKCGLSERGILFDLLFRALDAFIYVVRKSSPVSRKEIIRTGKLIFNNLILSFLGFFENNKKEFTDNEKKLISKLNSSNSFEKNIDIALDILEIFDSDLKNKYLKFYDIALENDWGIVT